MKKSIEEKVFELVARAKKLGKKPDIKTVGTSSLHQIIKTKEQADRFMKSLNEA